MLKDNLACYNYRDVAWSNPVNKGGFIYYVYETRVQGDCDKVYRLAIDEHDDLLKRIISDDVCGLDKGWLKDCCDPYILSDKVV